MADILEEDDDDLVKEEFLDFENNINQQEFPGGPPFDDDDVNFQDELQQEKQQVDELNCLLEKISCFWVVVFMFFIALHHHFPSLRLYLPFSDFIPTQISLTIGELFTFLNKLHQLDLCVLLLSLYFFPNYHHEVAHFHWVFFFYIFKIFFLPDDFFHIPHPTDFDINVYSANDFISILSAWCYCIWWILLTTMLLPTLSEETIKPYIFAFWSLKVLSDFLCYLVAWEIVCTGAGTSLFVISVVVWTWDFKGAWLWSSLNFQF